MLIHQSKDGGKIGVKFRPYAIELLKVLEVYYNIYLFSDLAKDLTQAITDSIYE